MGSVAIVGGGAAGMMASIAAAEAGHQVTVYEKNEKLGKKLFITGKGRCNVTNACDLDGLAASVVTNAKFLFSCFHRFSNQDMMELLESCGCPLKTERGMRVYPASDKSSDVIRALSRRMEALGVTVRLNCAVGSLWVEGDGTGSLRGVVLKDGGRKVAADAVIVTTGGASYPSTGSTGDGYGMARQIGHRVTDLSPALVPLTALEEDAAQLQGLSLRNVGIRVMRGEKELYSDFGEMLFTHYGVSGPMILSASSFVAPALAKGPLILTIDLKPALTMEQLDARVLREFSGLANRQFHNALGPLFPAKLIPVIIRRSRIAADKKVHAVTREERRQLIEVTKGLAFTLTGLRGFSEAVVTQGGVSVREVNPSTMESKKLPGVFFAGEVLDLDAVTGGYNLQIAWSTGYLAGISVPHA